MHIYKHTHTFSWPPHISDSDELSLPVYCCWSWTEHKQGTLKKLGHIHTHQFINQWFVQAAKCKEIFKKILLILQKILSVWSDNWFWWINSLVCWFLIYRSGLSKHSPGFITWLNAGLKNILIHAFLYFLLTFSIFISVVQMKTDI